MLKQCEGVQRGLLSSRYKAVSFRIYIHAQNKINLNVNLKQLMPLEVHIYRINSFYDAIL